MTNAAASANVPAVDHPPSRFRPEIQGLRTTAAFLVAIYHVWFDRVSGGVDVFFVVSGFLITGSLTRELSRTGSIRVGAYLGRIARRIVPAAYVVLAFTMIGTTVMVSGVFWEETFRDITAASVYLANWQFAANSVDYLAQDEFQSPALHFWALSIQGQFYVVWPLVLLLIAGIAMATRRRQRVGLMLPAVVVIFVASLWYSVVATNDNQLTAYFSTMARIWEFALGGLLALTITWFRPARRLGWVLGWVMGWLGLAMIIGTGALLDVGGAFPGWAALIPTIGAVLVVLAGNAPGPPAGAIRLLSSRPLVALGDMSYAFFLWHWPLLVFTKLYLDVQTVSVIQGSAVLLVSLGLAWITARWVERPFLARRTRAARTGRVVELAALCAVPVMLFVGAQMLVSEPDAPDPLLAVLGEAYPGGLVFEANFDHELLMYSPLIPDPLIARRDRPVVYEDGCHQRDTTDEALLCTYGVLGGPRIALVGGSHAAQWHPALESIAMAEGWELVNITKSACRFGHSDERSDSCTAWIDHVMTELLADPPAVMFTTATTGSRSDERVVAGFPRKAELLAEAGITVVGIRDNPWFTFDVPECVDENRDDPTVCSLLQADRLKEVNPAEVMQGLTDHVELIDLTSHLCADGVCPAVAGNVLMYRDRHHLTVPYSRSLGPVLARELIPILDRFEVVHAVDAVDALDGE